MKTEFTCQLQGQCSGCQWLNESYETQISLKQNILTEALTQLGVPKTLYPVKSIGAQAQRSRLDLTLETLEDGIPRLGLYGSQREIVDMKACPMAHPELEKWLIELRSHPLPKIKKGSLRLRISPKGERGVWIDFSNQDIKTLLDEENWLRHLKSKAIVEVGQRNKRLIEKDGRLKLGDPEHFSWFETYLGEEMTSQSLYLPLSGFTQTGFSSNKLLIKTAMNFVKETGAQDILELFSGCGNFTLALASNGLTVKALEFDNFAVDGLTRALKESGLEDRVQIKRQDLYRARAEDLQASVWFVDPPRSGLKSVLSVLEGFEESHRPRHLIYVSCFLESWSKDAERLLALGYKLDRVEGVDQFPNTPHCEWVSRFSLSAL